MPNSATPSYPETSNNSSGSLEQALDIPYSDNSDREYGVESLLTTRERLFRGVKDKVLAVKWRTSNVCQLCYNLSVKEFRAKKGASERVDWKLLLRMADRGCVSCQLLRGAVLAYSESFKATPDSVDIDGLMDDEEEPNEGPLKISLSFRRNEALEVRLEIYTTKEYPWLPRNMIAHNQTFDKSLNMKLACKWLSTCLKNHKRCARLLNGAIPSRLLDVSARHVRLVETDKINSADKRFVALSWCWGGKVPLKTTPETLKAHLNGVLWESLPPLFQDVIYAVRALGLKYLWIDALCIIQGSAEDWEKEAAKMQGVYQNATVTIAADGTQNCLGRLFQHNPRRLANRTWPFDLPRAGKQDEKAAAFVRLFREKDARGWHSAQLPDAGELYKDEDSGFLTSRSWCFQEQVLPARTLHFASTEVAWECLEGTQCECRALPEKITSQISSKTDFDPDQWTIMVEEMTLRDITYTADRLPAIGGLASQFSDQETYLAGLWKSKLIQHLAWKRVGSYTDTAERILGCHAPTWSWASLTGPVSFQFEGLPTAKLLDFSCKPATKNPFGPVQEDSFIDLEALTIDTVIQNASEKESLPADEGFIFNYKRKRLFSAWDFDDWDIDVDIEILDEIRLALESGISRKSPQASFMVIELGTEDAKYRTSTGLLLACIGGLITLNASVRGGEFVSFDEQESSNIEQDILDPGLFQPMIGFEPFTSTLERLTANLPESINKVVSITHARNSSVQD